MGFKEHLSLHESGVASRSPSCVPKAKRRSAGRVDRSHEQRQALIRTNEYALIEAKVSHRPDATLNALLSTASGVAKNTSCDGRYGGRLASKLASRRLLLSTPGRSSPYFDPYADSLPPPVVQAPPKTLDCRQVGVGSRPNGSRSSGASCNPLKPDSRRKRTSTSR